MSVYLAACYLLGATAIAVMWFETPRVFRPAREWQYLSVLLWPLTVIVCLGWLLWERLFAT